jgi:hypothetical protein
MNQPLVDQLFFSRSEFIRGIQGVDEEEGRRRFEPINCIAWMVGHMAWHEQLYWLTRSQGLTPLPILNQLVASHKPASSPSINEMLGYWKLITHQADDYLIKLDENSIRNILFVSGDAQTYMIGNMMQRMIYHYWFHLGESQAVRQLLGHKNLPSYVGDLEKIAPYR